MIPYPEKRGACRHVREDFSIRALKRVTREIDARLKLAEGQKAGCWALPASVMHAEGVANGDKDSVVILGAGVGQEVAVSGKRICTRCRAAVLGAPVGGKW